MNLCSYKNKAKMLVISIANILIEFLFEFIKISQDSFNLIMQNHLNIHCNLQNMNNLVALFFVTMLNNKTKGKTKTNYTLEKKVTAASIFRRYKRSYVGET
jgi:hypothetical protein